MAYTVENFKTKKTLKEACARGQQPQVFQPDPFGPDVKDGPAVIEGPHGYHKWYAQVRVVSNRITKFIK